MSTTISAANYQSIAGYYGNVKKVLGTVSGYLFGAVTTIANMNDVEPTYDLMTQFYNSYQVNSSTLASDLPLLAAVRTLNSHVLNRGGYTSIGATSDNTSFLHVQSITVPQGWADLCSSTGQVIDASHISG